MFKKAFSFNGRIRRTEYGLSYIMAVVVLGIIGMMMESFAPNDENGSMMLLILIVPVYWFIFAQGAKRCHDLDKTGWFQIIPFYFFWMIFQDSQFGPNEYGDNPKGLGNYPEIEEIGKHLST